MIVHLFFVLVVLSQLGLNGVHTLIKPGRRVCPVSRAALQVVPSIQTYIRPFNVNCSEDDCSNSSRVVYKIATRTVFYRRVIHDSVRKCCPGWTSFEANNEDCMKPVCQSECLNGGTCDGPEYCACPQNFTGAHCEFDVNECQTGRHDCQQLCNNTYGGYVCQCYNGFRLTNEKDCEFCPLCVTEFEHVMNKVDELQTRLKTVESSKEEIKAEFSVLQQNYKDALDKVGELKEAQIKYTLTTPALPKDEGRINPRSNFDLITSLSDQLGAIEEQIGYMMTQIGTQNNRGNRQGQRRT